MKKSLLLLIVSVVFLAACDPKMRSHRPGADKKGGGVDVGNMHGDNPGQGGPEILQAKVPGTDVLLSYPETWSLQSRDQELNLKSSSGSTIGASLAEVKLVNPNQQSLKIHLMAQHPGQEFHDFNSSELPGVAATDAASGEKTVWLISPAGQVVKVVAHLESDAKEGEEILSSARVRYLGEPYKNQVAKSVVLKEYFKARAADEPGRYSFKGDCFEGPGCTGSVTVNLEFYNEQLLLNLNDHGGRIVDLGPKTQVPFDSLRVDGDYLVSAKGNTPLADIYTVFTAEKPTQSLQKVAIQEGHVYLIRTKDWGREDIVTKLIVDAIEPEHSMAFRYQKLTFVSDEALERELEAIREYNRIYEQPRDTGEVVLFNRTEWDNYYYANFNFEYSTSGAVVATGNSWDIKLERNYLDIPITSWDLGHIQDMGDVSLESLQISDFVDPNTLENPYEMIPIRLGHSYLIRHVNSDGKLILGGVKVLELDPGYKWARLQFRRFHVGPLEEFQNWLDLDVPQEILELEITPESQSIQLFGETNYKGSPDSYFFRASDDWDVTMDIRPYPHLNGHLLYEGDRSFENLRAEDFPEQGYQKRVEDLKSGDVLLIRWIGIYEKEELAIQVVETSESSIRLRIRRLYSGKAPFSSEHLMVHEPFPRDNVSSGEWPLLSPEDFTHLDWNLPEDAEH